MIRPLQLRLHLQVRPADKRTSTALFNHCEARQMATRCRVACTTANSNACVSAGAGRRIYDSEIDQVNDNASMG